MLDVIEPTYILDDSTRNELLIEITNEEVFCVLQSIHEEKALGNDGINRHKPTFGWY